MRAALCLIALALAACNTGQSAAPAAPSAAAAKPAVMVESEALVAAPLSREVVAVGALRSAEAVTLAAEVAGRITQIGFKEGQPVTAGQLLFALDDAVNRAEQAQTLAAQQLASRSAERAKELFERKLISAADRDTALANQEVAAANLALARAKLDKMRILAPFAGIAGLRQVSVGSFVTSGQVLVNLEDLSSIKLDFRLAEVSLPYIAVGQRLRVEVDAWPGQPFTGEVYAIDPRVADTTRSIGVRARLPNADGKLKPGLFARVMLELSRKDAALRVPEQALFPRGDSLFVYAIEDGKAVLKQVRTGLRSEGRVEIVEGLKAGDAVITAGHQKIGPGSAVTVAGSGA